MRVAAAVMVIVSMLALGGPNAALGGIDAVCAKDCHVQRTVCHKGCKSACRAECRDADDSDCRPTCKRGCKRECAEYRQTCRDDCARAEDGDSDSGSDSDSDSDSECRDDGAIRDGKLIFATSNGRLVPGVDFSSLAGADDLCSSIANLAGLAVGHSFRAWLSDSTVDAIDRIEGVTAGTFVNTRNEVVSVDGLGNGLPLVSPVHYDENGMESPSIFTATYTATGPSGRVNRADRTCSDWTSNDSQSSAVAGTPTSAHSEAWTSSHDALCSQGASLYCVEVEQRFTAPGLPSRPLL